MREETNEMNIMRATSLTLALVGASAALPPLFAVEPAASRSYEELFSGLPRPFAQRAPAPNPGLTPAATANALYSNEVFFNLRNSFEKPVTDYLAPCLSKGLIQHFDASRAEIARWFEHHKNVEPKQKLPMNEGAVFVSCYEGATGYRLGETTITNERARVKVHLTYKEGEQMVEWVDIALLIRAEGKWLLDDILFDPDRSPGYTLRKRTKIHQ